MSKALNKLTAMAVKKAERTTLQDGGGLSITKTTADSGRWSYKYTFAHRRRNMGLGSYPIVSLSEAREARDKWASLLRQGISPIEERKRLMADEQAAQNRTDPTFEQMAKTVLEAKKAGLKRDGEAGRWLSPLTIHMFPVIGSRRISQIHPTDVKDALSPIWKTQHPTATKAIQRTKIVFESAKLMGIECDPFVVDQAKHMLGEVRHKVKHIEATPWQEIPALYDRIGDDRASKLALRWIILTAARSNACLGARFDEVEGNIWTIPAERMKGKEGETPDFRVPLSSEAMRILEQCRAVATGDYLFMGNKGQPISPQAPHKVLKGVGGLSLHGFRTSFRTWVQDTEAATYDVAETALAHNVGNKVERSYARSDVLEKRAVLMEAWAGFVVNEDDNVVKLRR